MSQNTFFIFLQQYSAYATEVLTVINVLWMVEICINAVIQHKQLNSFVEGNWKLDLEISTLFSVLGLALLYAPRWITQFGREIYIITIFFYIIQILFTIDNRKTLAKYIITKSSQYKPMKISTWFASFWYYKSMKISIWIASLSIVTVFAFFISQIAVSDF